MTDPLTIATGAVSIATVFTSCVDCFSYVQSGRHFRRDFQTDLLALDYARLRLKHWGHAANVYDDPKFGRPDATPFEIQTVEQSIHQLSVLFADTEKIVEKYKSERGWEDDRSVLTAHDIHHVFGFRSNLKQLVIKRRGRASALNSSSWALYHRSELRDLISRITSLIDNIEKIFPVHKHAFAFVDPKINGTQDEKPLKEVEGAIQGGDTRAADGLTGHRYQHINIEGTGQAGDLFTQGWTGNTTGPNHDYVRIVVSKGAKGLIGNQFGGADFWSNSSA